jgi:hypothetical protein
MQIYKELSRNFLPKFTKRWHAATRNRTKFEKKNENWLKNIFSINKPPTEPDVATEEPGPSNRSRSGRAEKSFKECCDRTKRNKVKSLCENYPEVIIIKAANKIQEESSELTGFTPAKALALMLDASLSKYQYEILRKDTKPIGCDIFPGYRKF